MYFGDTHKAPPWAISFMEPLVRIEALAVSNQEIDAELLHNGSLPEYIHR